MKNIFTDHPKSIGESYLQHFKFAFLFGMNMLIAGVACLVHAIFPFLFQKTGSNILLKMTRHFVERMPRTEDRIVSLSQSLERKIHENAKKEFIRH
ncbi:DUF6356 family protein [Aquicella lusitana]|uniref:Capsule biosynthesis protein n=1 Tax=Aquicella lusitana TaxID=254246 RepID=A0A370GGW3_9COXI|nr:DUF6356 family protein [Aquicella lusitana]RDI42580.1 hypothetical protein C8D86_11451 [Aquicella lusitana]VVC74359.1 hypothetical protein AQULUS_21240 [Aquicella lusitana]